MRLYFLFSQSWIPTLSESYHYLQSLHALHPHYHISNIQQLAQTLPTVHLLFSNYSSKPSEQRMQIKSVAIAPQVLAIGHIGSASHSLVLCCYWRRNKSPDLGGCTVTHSTASEKGEKKKIKREFHSQCSLCNRRHEEQWRGGWNFSVQSYSTATWFK